MSIIAIIRYWVLSLLVGSIVLSVLLFVHEGIANGSISDWEMLYGNALFALIFSGILSLPVPISFMVYEQWIRKELKSIAFYNRMMFILIACYLIFAIFQSGWNDLLRTFYFLASYAVPGGYFLRKELLKQKPH